MKTNSTTEMNPKLENSVGSKKLRKRRELDALLTRSLNRKGSCNKNVYSQDKLLSASTDDADEYILPKLALSPSTMSRRFFTYRICGILLVVGGITLSVGFISWLYFDIREEIYEYRKKINEVAATSQSLPATLQEWHDTTAALFKNHSSLLMKLHELQFVMDSLRKNMSDCKSLFDEKIKYNQVEKLVADFGAKIEAVATDIEGVKIHYGNLNSKQKLIRDAIINLKGNLSEVRSLASTAMESQANYTKELSTLQSILLYEFGSLKANLTLVNNTLSQKTMLLNEELLAHKVKLYKLDDQCGNITSQVKSAGNSFPVLKNKLSEYENTTSQLGSKIYKNVAAKNNSNVQNIFETNTPETNKLTSYVNKQRKII